MPGPDLKIFFPLSISRKLVWGIVQCKAMVVGPQDFFHILRLKLSNHISNLSLFLQIASGRPVEQLVQPRKLGGYLLTMHLSRTYCVSSQFQCFLFENLV